MDLLITFAAFFVLALFLRAAAHAADHDAHPYAMRKYLLSKAERSFHGVLQQAAPPGTQIYSKVRMADVLQVRKGARNRLGFFNKISSKHFDFVLTDASTSAIIAVIELDDASHRSNRAKISDTFKNKATDAADLPLMRVDAARSYGVADLRMRLKALMPAGETEQSRSNGRPHSSVDTESTSVTLDSTTI